MRKSVMADLEKGVMRKETACDGRFRERYYAKMSNDMMADLEKGDMQK